MDDAIHSYLISCTCITDLHLTSCSTLCTYHAAAALDTLHDALDGWEAMACELYDAAGRPPPNIGRVPSAPVPDMYDARTAMQATVDALAAIAVAVIDGLRPGCVLLLLSPAEPDCSSIW